MLHLIIKENSIDKEIKRVSETLYGKDKDIIYSNAKVRDFIKGLNREGTLIITEDEKQYSISFENEDWGKGLRKVSVYSGKIGKRAKMKRLAIVLLCSLIVKGYYNSLSEE